MTDAGMEMSRRVFISINLKMELWGDSRDADSYKCLMTAAEKGVDVAGHYVDVTGGGTGAAEFRSRSPFGAIPVLKDREFVLWGTLPIMSYLDDKGFGPSLIPRNANLRSIHYQWIYNALYFAKPHVEALVAGQAANMGVLNQVFDALEAILKANRRGDFIASEYSLADIHWGAYAHFLGISGHGVMISSRPSVQAWWGKVKQHPSTSKEKILASSVLPSADELNAPRLKGVAINS